MGKIDIFLIKGKYACCPCCGSADYVEVVYIFPLPFLGRRYIKRCIFCGEITGSGKADNVDFSELQLAHVQIDNVAVMEAMPNA